MPAPSDDALHRLEPFLGTRTLEGVWTLSRSQADFSPLDFHQRWTGRFGDDGRSISGRWEISRDGGATWEHDFDLRYERVG